MEQLWTFIVRTQNVATLLTKNIHNEVKQTRNASFCNFLQPKAVQFF